jgi:hypothetical protein
MTSYTIEINMDKKCKKCGKPGATQCGLCMKCVSKEISKMIKDGRVK